MREIDEQLAKVIRDEGNYYAGEYKGYKYRVLRRYPFGLECENSFNLINLNGYVFLEKNNRFYGKDYDDIPVDCHGGLTYSDRTLFYQPEKGWWIGFDTAHIGDKADISENSWLGETYKDLNYVKRECKSIINQIILLNKEIK